MEGTTTWANQDGAHYIIGLLHAYHTHCLVTGSSISVNEGVLVFRLFISSAGDTSCLFIFMFVFRWATCSHSEEGIYGPLFFLSLPVHIQFFSCHVTVVWMDIYSLHCGLCPRKLSQIQARAATCWYRWSGKHASLLCFVSAYAVEVNLEPSTMASTIAH